MNEDDISFKLGKLAHAGDGAAVQTYVRAGASVNATGHDMRTALHVAARMGHGAAAAGSERDARVNAIVVCRYARALPEV